MYTHTINSILGNKLYRVENGIITAGDTNFPKKYIGTSHGMLKKLVNYYRIGMILSFANLPNRSWIRKQSLTEKKS